MTRRTVDVVVIGGGPVGENVAERTSSAGLETVVVERELVGGECSYWACMPSKALLGPPRRLAEAKAMSGVPVPDDATLDVAAVLRRRDAFAARWSDAGQVEWLEGVGVDLVRGDGRVTGDREVTVTGDDGAETVLTARRAVVAATGSTPVVPPVPGLAASRPWGSREATSAQAVPPRLAVIGGGVVAVELATAFRALGSEVTLIARSGLLGAFEPVAAERVRRALEDAGVDVRTDTETTRVDRAADGVRVETGDGTVVADEVLVATGRRPASAGLGLEPYGVEPGRAVPVDETMLVPGTDWLYAVGDLNGRALLTHQGKYQARAAGDAIAARAAGRPVDDAPWGAHVATADHVAVPQVVFTDPEVASVGETAASAEAAGRRVRVVDVDLHSVAGAVLEGDRDPGAARLVIDDDLDVVVGATFVGPGVAELLQTAAAAIVGQIPVDRLWHVVPPYPTVSEVWLRLLEADGRPRT